MPHHRRDHYRDPSLFGNAGIRSIIMTRRKRLIAVLALIAWVSPFILVALFGLFGAPSAVRSFLEDANEWTDFHTDLGAWNDRCGRLARRERVLTTAETTACIKDMQRLIAYAEQKGWGSDPKGW